MIQLDKSICEQLDDLYESKVAKEKNRSVKRRNAQRIYKVISILCNNLNKYYKISKFIEFREENLRKN